MERKRRSGLLTFSVFILALALGTPAGAEYPERAVTIINPQAPGGAHDAQGRAFATVAEKYLGKPMVVVNKPGASTMIGTVSAAEAAPDGYTLLLGFHHDHHSGGVGCGQREKAAGDPERLRHHRVHDPHPDRYQRPRRAAPGRTWTTW